MKLFLDVDGTQKNAIYDSSKTNDVRSSNDADKNKKLVFSYDIGESPNYESSAPIAIFSDGSSNSMELDSGVTIKTPSNEALDLLTNSPSNLTTTPNTHIDTFLPSYVSFT